MSVRQANLIAASIAVLTGFVFVSSSVPIYSAKIGGGPGAGIFPFWIGLLVVACGLAYLRESLKDWSPERFMTFEGNQKVLFLQCALSIIAYVALMPYLGFALASFLLLVFHLRVIGRYRLLFAVLFASAVSALLAYCFRFWLYMSLPRGFVGW